MFYIRKNVALSNKSREIYDALIDPDSNLSRIKKEFDFSFIYDEIKNNYCLDNGRNSIDGVVALRALFIQCYFGLRERQLEIKATYDIQIKHFLDIEIDDKSFDFTTIWKFKKMLGDEKVEVIFNNILTQIKSKGIIHSFRRQAIDTVPIVAAAALPSITCLIYQAINGVYRSIDERLATEILKETELTPEKLDNYSKAHPLFESEQNDRLKAFQKATSRGFIVLSIADKNQLNSESISLLREILQDNVQQTGKDNYDRKQTPHAKKSLVDKDAGFGHKTKEKTVFGYKAGISVVREGIITAYEVTSMSHRDDEHLVPILEKQEKNNVKCEEAYADSAFGFIQNYANAENLNVVLHSPLRNFDPEKLSVYDFNHNQETREITCSNNVTVKGKNAEGLTFEFPLKTCRCCPKAAQCPLAPSKVTNIHENHDVARRAIARQREDKDINKKNREKGIKNFQRLVVENVLAFLEKLGIKTTPAYSLNMTKVHVGIVATFSNMIKTVRFLKKQNQTKADSALPA